MQTVSKKIVQSRTNSTLVGVFSIILVFISAFVNMVSARQSRARRGKNSKKKENQQRPVVCQFACDTTSLEQCVAEKLNTSAALVTPCLIRSLNVSLEGGLEICPSQGPSCPFPEVSLPSESEMSHLHLRLCAVVNGAAVPPVPVFQLQRAADAAGLLRVPADQQHREAGPHAAHPVQLPAAGGVATSSTAGQCRPFCLLQCHVRAKRIC